MVVPVAVHEMSTARLNGSCTAIAGVRWIHRFAENGPTTETTPVRSVPAAGAHVSVVTTAARIAFASISSRGRPSAY